MNREEAKKRIEKLKKEINYHRYLYHVLDRQEISDAALDSLKYELHKLEQKFPEFITFDSPTQRVGGRPLEKFKKVRHTAAMLSIEDVFSPEELRNWEQRMLKILPGRGFDYYSEVKMDGLAVSLIYIDGLLKVGATRGDGKVGEDVTLNLKTIEAIPLRLRVPEKKEIDRFIQKFGGSRRGQGTAPNPDLLRRRLLSLQGRIEVRGETFMSKKVFEEINREQKKLNKPVFANPRNAAAGSIRQLDPKITASRRLDFYGYALMGDLGQKTHEQAHELMKLIGIKTNPLNRFCRNLDEAVLYHKEIYKKREGLSYWTDGVVISINNDADFDKLGVVGKAPRGMIAYKFPAEQATTMLKEVRWQIGRTGVLTPVATLEPVTLGGTTVSHATLHNFDEIQRLGVKIGDTVIVEKAGDIIPKIVKTLPRIRTGKEKTIHPPSQCPNCGSKISHKHGEVYITCPRPNCFARQHRKIFHFVSKGAFDIEGLGSKIVEQFIQNGLISTPADLFTLRVDDIKPLERFAEKSAENIIHSINKSKEITLARFIYSLGVLHVGEETAIDLANHFGTLESLQKASLRELETVPNIGKVVAESISTFFRDKQNLALIKALINNGVKIKEIKKRRSLPLAGKTFVLTGALEAVARDKAKKRIRELGGDVSSSVSKKTDYVVVGKEPGTKYEKAKKLGIKILKEKEFLDIITNN